MYDDGFDTEQEDDERLTDGLPKPPENMKLTIEVGLSEYSPNGLLELIARGLFQQIGGPQRWATLLDKMMKEKAEEHVRQFVEATVARIWNQGAADLDFVGIVRKAAEEYMQEKVRSDGARTDSYDQNRGVKRIEWLVSKLTKEAMDGAFKQAEAEWRASTQAAIKETIGEALAARLTKALPSPPELR